MLLVDGWNRLQTMPRRPRTGPETALYTASPMRTSLLPPPLFSLMLVPGWRPKLTGANCGGGFDVLSNWYQGVVAHGRSVTAHDV